LSPFKVKKHIVRFIEDSKVNLIRRLFRSYFLNFLEGLSEAKGVPLQELIKSQIDQGTNPLELMEKYWDHVPLPIRVCFRRFQAYMSKFDLTDAHITWFMEYVVKEESPEMYEVISTEEGYNWFKSWIFGLAGKQPEEEEVEALEVEEVCPGSQES